MKVFAAVALLAVSASALVVPSDYPAPAPSSDAYGTDSGSDGYGQPKCTYYDDTVHREHCENYEEKVCATTQHESCADVGDRNCRGVVSSKQNRKCFDVTELRCSLKEDVKLETVQVPVTVQKCRKVPEKVCDTIYGTSVSTKEKFQCINVDKSKCVMTPKTVYDRTCRTTFTFDCQTSGYASPAYGGSGGDQQDAYGGDSGDAYGSDAGSYGSDNGADDYSSQDSYGVPKPYCHRNAETKCYKTPRQVTVQTCTTYPEKVCEKMAEKTPSVHPRQVCHNEEKRVCELVKRTEAKQVKKYVYSKQCRNVPRQVCDNADTKTLVPSCVPTTRKKCTYSPTEACEQVPRKKCFQLAYKVRKQKCEKGKAYPEPEPAYGGNEPSYGASEPAYGASEPAYGASEPSYGGKQDSGYGDEPNDGY